MSILNLEIIMPRMTKCRKIGQFPDYFSFTPDDTEKDAVGKIILSLDEFETMRLLDYEGLNQEQCAKRMGVARTTVTAMYDSVRTKIACALVEGKRIGIAGGNIEIDRERNCLIKAIKEKGEKTMRVAVTYDNGDVFGHFGKTEAFKIYDIEDGKVVASEILGTNGEGCGALAGILNVADVDALICGGIGGGAKNALEEAGIKLYSGVTGNTDLAVKALMEGNLNAGSEANCNHHDHDHENGHSCGHGGCHH